MNATSRYLVAGSILFAGSAATAAGFDPVEPYNVSPDYFRATLGYYVVREDGPFPFGNDNVGWYGDVEAERQYGNILAFGGIGFEHNDFFNSQFIELGAAYYVTPNVLVGGQVNFDHFDFGGSATDYSVFAQYEGTNGAIALSYTVPEFGDNFVVVSGEYMFGAQTSIYGSWYHDDDEDFVTVNLGHTFGATKANLVLEADDDDYHGALIYLDHQMNDRVRLFGAVGASSNGPFDSNFAAVGVGYKVADNLWLEGGYGKYNSDFGDGDVIAVNLTYDIGKSKRVERRVDNSYRDIYDGIGYSFGF